MQKSRRC